MSGFAATIEIRSGRPPWALPVLASGLLLACVGVLIADLPTWLGVACVGVLIADLPTWLGVALVLGMGGGCVNGLRHGVAGSRLGWKPCGLRRVANGAWCGIRVNSRRRSCFTGRDL